MERLECVLAPEAELPSCDHRVAELYQYWLAIRPTHTLLPGRQHFDPIAIPNLLRSIWLLDVHRNPLRFKYRLCGTELVRTIDRDPTGRWLHEDTAQLIDGPTYPQYIAAAEQSMVCYRRGFPLLYQPKDFMVLERLLLPLAKNGTDVDMLVVLGLFSSVEKAAEKTDRGPSPYRELPAPP